MDKESLKRIILDGLEDITLLQDEAVNDSLYEYLFDIIPDIDGDEIANAIDEILSEHVFCEK